MSKRAEVRIRLARPDEREDLEALQWRASTALPDYRKQLEGHPDAIELPAVQLERGEVLIAEVDGAVAGFAAVVAGELDGLFVEPHLWRNGVGAALVEAAALEAR
ncbi:MAG: GNAT family N-acetyltransferase, partial [Sphingomicrobium sp.]